MENDFQIKYLQLTDNTLNPPHTTHMNLTASPQCTGERATKCKTATVCGVRVSSKTERFLIRCLSHLVYEHLEAEFVLGRRPPPPAGFRCCSVFRGSTQDCKSEKWFSFLSCRPTCAHTITPNLSLVSKSGEEIRHLINWDSKSCSIYIIMHKQWQKCWLHVSCFIVLR